MATKGEIVKRAYEELRISGITVNASNRDIISAIHRLDDLLAAYNNCGLCLGYNKSATYSDVEPTQESGLSDSDVLAVVLNLAVGMAPAFGKPIHPQTLSAAKFAYEGLFPVELPHRENSPYLPKGGGDSFGSQFHDRYRYQHYEQNAPANCNTNELKLDQTKIFSFDFTDQFRSGDTILSYTLTDGEGVEATNDSQTDGVLTAFFTGSAVGYSAIAVVLTMTPSGEVNPITLDFNVV